MNQKRFDRLIQLVLALAVLALLAWLTSRGDIAGTDVLWIIGAILAAFGFEAGRRTEYRR